MTTERSVPIGPPSEASGVLGQNAGSAPYWTGNLAQPSPHRAVMMGICGAFIAFLALLLHTQGNDGLKGPPPISGDELEYDSLGWELSQGRGYQTNLSQPEFREPYGTNRDSIPSTGPSPNTYRPPFVPWVMAGWNRLLGRQFWAMRMVNLLATAASCGMIVGLATWWGGPLAGGIGILHVVAVDWRMRAYSRSLLTESLTLFWVTLLFLLLMRFSSRQRMMTALQAGCVLGLGILTRSMLVIWLLPLCVFVGYVTRSAAASRRWLCAAVFAVSALVVVSPWAIRNVRVLERLMPLGTQFSMEFSAGYSDLAVSRRGVWTNLREAGFFPKEMDAGSGFEREKQMADYSSRQAWHWLATHPGALPGLALWKILQEIRPWGIGELYLSVLGVIGLLALRRTHVGPAGIALLGSCLLGISLTWSTGGRFLFPVLSILHVGAAVAGARLLESSIRQPVDPSFSADSRSKKPSLH